MEKKLNLLTENLEEKDSELKLKDQRIAELKSELLNRDSGKDYKTLRISIFLSKLLMLKSPQATPQIHDNSIDFKIFHEKQ